MIVKIIGFLIIVFSCGTFGYSVKRKHIIRLKELDNMLLCADILEKEMNLFLSTLEDAFSAVYPYASSYNKSIFKNAVKLHNESDGDSFQNIWIDTLNKAGNDIYNKEDTEVLKKFGNLLGVGDSQIQKENTISLKNSLHELIMDAKSKNEKINLFPKIGIYSGIIIAILLI